ncbi:MAG: hypothetical protein HYW01_06310 [Deltaproteobacteria bacterium]|nr:hypothetical protein [Deltaproteobacteria bacterium]
MKILGDEKLGDKLPPKPNAIDNLPISKEAKDLYINFCLKQRESIKSQMEKGIKLPKIELTNVDREKYRKTYSIGKDKFNEIVEELKKYGLIF